MYIIIVGCGVMGKALVTHIINEGHEVVIVEKDGDKAKNLAESMDALIIHGDGSDTRILKDAGIERADAVAILTSDDNTNLTICQILKRFNIPRIVARVNDPAKRELYISLEITAAISPVSAIVSYFKNALTQGTSRSLTSIAGGNAEVIELKVSNENLFGKKIKEIGLPAGVIIGLVYRNGEIIVGTGGTVLKKDDTLTIITKTEVVKDVISLFKEEGK